MAGILERHASLVGGLAAVGITFMVTFWVRMTEKTTAKALEADKDSKRESQKLQADLQDAHREIAEQAGPQQAIAEKLHSVQRLHKQFLEDNLQRLLGIINGGSNEKAYKALWKAHRVVIAWKIATIQEDMNMATQSRVIVMKMLSAEDLSIEEEAELRSLIIELEQRLSQWEQDTAELQEKAEHLLELPH